MNKIFTTLLLAAAIASVTAILSPTSVFAPTNNAQDDKNNPGTYPGEGAGNLPPDQAQNQNADDNTFRNCNRFDTAFPDVGNGRNLPAQCYGSP
jgi:hypothetical protein